MCGSYGSLPGPATPAKERLVRPGLAVPRLCQGPASNSTTQLCLGRAVDAAAISHARVPELTASAGIKLTERHSLRRCKNRIR
jgi:hypothetical protein